MKIKAIMKLYKITKQPIKVKDSLLIRIIIHFNYYNSNNLVRFSVKSSKLKDKDKVLIFDYNFMSEYYYIF
jgi:hypothetical protein